MPLNNEDHTVVVVAPMSPAAEESNNPTSEDCCNTGPDLVYANTMNCAKVHSYYDCCVHVHASSLLDHWLDEDTSSISTVTTPTSKTKRRRCGCRSSHRRPRLAVPTLNPLLPPSPPASPVSNIDLTHEEEAEHECKERLKENEEEKAETDPHEWIRQICAAGCDVNTQDHEGRTILHHLLTGNVNFGESSLVDLTLLLLHTGADPNAKDRKGVTPILQLQHLLKKEMFADALAIAQILLYSPSVSSDINRLDAHNRTLLSYSVTHGDRSAELTRLLLNHGALVWPSAEVTSYTEKENVIEQVTQERDQSAFTWFLKSVMEHQSLDATATTLYLISTSMGQDPSRMKRHVSRTMLQLGKGASVNGPLFLQLKLELMPFWSGPQDLRFQCLKTLRRSLGPKRLTGGGEKLLRLPVKLQRYLKLDEPIAVSSSSVPVETKQFEKIGSEMTYPDGGEIAKVLLEKKK